MCAKIATVTTDSASTCRLSRKPSQTRGSDDQNVSGSKNDCCTFAHPGVLMTVSHTTPAKASVEASATNTDLVDWRLRYARRSSSRALGVGAASVTIRR